jgi:hypothetical protein
MADNFAKNDDKGLMWNQGNREMEILPWETQTGEVTYTQLQICLTLIEPYEFSVTETDIILD